MPALPRNNSACLTGKFPPQPCTRNTCDSSCSTTTPSVRKPSSMRSVSSDSSTSRISVVPCASADSSRMRLEMLFEPGSVTVPRALNKGGRSMKFSDVIAVELHRRFAGRDDTAKPQPCCDRSIASPGYSGLPALKSPASYLLQCWMPIRDDVYSGKSKAGRVTDIAFALKRDQQAWNARGGSCEYKGILPERIAADHARA